MKKLISVLLAVSALALSTSAFAAAPTVSNRNPGATTLADEQTGKLPCFRNGDTVTFNLTGLTGSQLTLISSKVGATAGNDTIQYINQYTVSGGTQSVTYKVRELTNGTYNILIKDGNAPVVDYFYTVANPSVTLLTASANSTDYVLAKNEKNEKNDQAFAAVASVEGATFTESGVASVGFKFDASNGTKYTSSTLTAAKLDSIATEVGGKLNVVYGITVKEVANGVTVTPTAVMN